ncbi:MAG TPA: tyrosine-type recombinase/integrase [Gemmataceae bacterium]
MTEVHSTGATAHSKPAKPYPDFPLFPHATGRWAKKIRGRFVYFGPWSDPDGALAKYLAEKDALHAGRTPQPPAEALTVHVLAGRYLTTKKRKLDAGELSPRSFADYTATCKGIIKAFGKARLVADLRPEDFEKLRAALAKKWGPVRLGNEVNRVRMLFRYGQENGLLNTPIVFGEGFQRPTRKTLRLHKQAQGPKMFEAAEIRSMLKAAGQPLKAMILLGVNCGFGNADVGTLPLSALDLAGGWVIYPRPKTGIDRRCPLWPETVAALKQWLKVRPRPEDPAGANLVFLTRTGGRWTKDGADGLADRKKAWTLTDNPLSKEARKLLDALGIDGHRNFYALRHTFQTVGDESGDFLAVRSIMGHAGGNDIANEYRERLSDARLRKVAEHVRTWLFGRKK